MTFWIVALALAAVSALLIVLALLRGGGQAVEAADYDLKVYRDQLREVEKDVARRVLSPEEAERATIEISRRILEADQARTAIGTAAEQPRGVTLGAGAAVALAVVAGSALLYREIGAPNYPDLPLEARIAFAEERRASRPGQEEVEETLGTPAPRTDVEPAYLQLIERLRATVSERQDDPQGLMLLARNEAALGNFAAAHAAQARLIGVKGEGATAADFADLADMLILAAGGYVSPEAEAAISEALRRDPQNGTARYYAGLLYAQIGRPDRAFRFWVQLLRESPPSAPWVPPIREQIEEIAELAGQHRFTLPPASAESAPAPGPTAEQVEAAEDMDPEARMEMIRGMVAGLAERLATEGGGPEDWARLIRAYGVLGEADKVLPILTEARQVFAADADALAEVEAAARDAGIAE